MNGMAVEFVKGWHLLQTLGEGAYGEVRLLVNSETSEAVAAKVIHLDKYPNAKNTIHKEVCIHRMLSHQNVIKFFGHRSDDNIEYIFLEYASGGELFDRIEPDIGMDLANAHRFFVQLISGVEYLHQKGIVHRDLKPENLLLDDKDNIKISDFGMSTVFRHSGKERSLNVKCGTMPYMSPEIFINKEYKAEPADIWSCGVILVTLLAGELPWDKPTSDCVAYRDWKECKITCVPWTKIDNLILSLLRKIMMPNVSKRYTLSQIKSHQWFKKNFNKQDSQSRAYSPSSPTLQHKKLCTTNGEPVYRLSSASQPIDCEANPQMTTTLTDPIKGTSFSQPVHPEDMFLSTQMHSTPIGNSQNIYQRLVRRMTRFFTNADAKTTLYKLKCVFDKHNYSYKKCSLGQLTITTIDKRRMPLVFKASVIEMTSKQILVDFRLSKGDGIEFKRHFVNIRNDLKDLIVKGPITWPLAFATNSLP